MRLFPKDLRILWNFWAALMSWTLPLRLRDLRLFTNQMYVLMP